MKIIQDGGDVKAEYESPDRRVPGRAPHALPRSRAWLGGSRDRPARDAPRDRPRPRSDGRASQRRAAARTREHSVVSRAPPPQADGSERRAISAAPQPLAAGTRRDERRWVLFTTIGLAAFIVGLDNTILNVALSKIKSEPRHVADRSAVGREIYIPRVLEPAARRRSPSATSSVGAARVTIVSRSSSCRSVCAGLAPVR